MNRLRLRSFTNEPDHNRPQKEFWGPARRTLGEQCADFDLQMDLLQPKPERCPVCSHNETVFVANVYGWPIHECTACEVGFVWPQPVDEFLEEYYEEFYAGSYLGGEKPLYFRPQLCSHIYLRQAQCLDRIMKRQRDARVLDVGAGDGTMLRLLKDLGYRHLHGIDLDERIARRARERLEVPVDRVNFLTYEQGGWDAITLWAVVEHLKDPLSYLRHANHLLNPGGLCLVMTGDNASAQAWVQGTLDMWVYSPEHLFFFTPNSLLQLFRQAGYTQFQWRLQFQALWKEAVLWSFRMVKALKTRLNPHHRFWRSVNSNLLLAWGYKSPNDT